MIPLDEQETLKMLWRERRRSLLHDVARIEGNVLQALPTTVTCLACEEQRERLASHSEE